MPRGDADDDWGKPTTTFLYGPDKTKKTWWALRAAEAGFNVILVDGDNGSSIKKMLSMEARKRMIIVDVVNTTTHNAYVRFMATFMRGQPFIWDEQDKRSYPMSWKLNPNHSHIVFNIQKFTMNDLICVDSWTRLASTLALEWASENNVDLTAVEKEGDQFSLMGYQSRFLNYVLDKIPTFPCHFMAIGHETVYEKFEGKGKDRKVVEQRTQPFSSTGPHAKKIGAHFSNILRFKKLSDLAFQIDAGGDADTMGGCRQLPPRKFNWNDISPATIFEAVGSKPTGEKCEGAIWLDKGEQLPSNLTVIKPSILPAQAATQSSAQVVDAAKAMGNVSLMSKLKGKNANV